MYRFIGYTLFLFDKNKYIFDCFIDCKIIKPCRQCAGANASHNNLTVKISFENMLLRVRNKKTIKMIFLFYSKVDYF